MKKRLFAILLAVSLMLLSLPTVTFAGTVISTASGTCDTNLSWDLTDGVLTISGNGSMFDYGWYSYPWSNYDTQVKKIVISSGVTSIGQYAFGCMESVTVLSIADTVTTINSNAFYNCIGLSSLFIPASVTTLYTDSFSECQFKSITVDPLNTTYFTDSDHTMLMSGTNLLMAAKAKTLVVPDTILSIAENAFSYNKTVESVVLPALTTCLPNFSDCTNLKSVTINGPITTIPDYTFSGCVSLESFRIPETVVSIGENAFSNCTSLTSISIPASVTTICESSFTSSGLTSLTVDEKNPIYSTDSNHQLLLSGGSTLLFAADVPEILVPESITAISSEAFDSKSNLQHIELPSTITELPSFEFDTALKTVVVKGAVTSIPDYAFYECSSMENFVIPESVTSIGRCAFEGCTSLKALNIPDAVTSISSGAFTSCSSLQSITIPTGISEIESSTFNDCSSLTEVTIPDNVTSFGNNVFYGCSSLKSVTIPQGVTDLKDSTFYGCSSLKSITIPESITYIDEYVFNGCVSLTSIHIPSAVTTIETTSFLNCNGISSVTVAAGNTSYSAANERYLFSSSGELIFVATNGLTDAVIPEGVTTISSRVFANSHISTVSIPSTLASITDNPFVGCQLLPSFTVSKDNSTYAVAGTTGSMLVNTTTTPHTLISFAPSGTYVASETEGLTIASDAFAGCMFLNPLTPSASPSTACLFDSGLKADVTDPSTDNNIGVMNPVTYGYNNDGYDLYYDSESEWPYGSGSSLGGGFTITDDNAPKETAQMIIYAYDVDKRVIGGEIDTVYLVDQSGKETALGVLSGMNKGWDTTILSVDPSLLTAGNYFLKITVSDGWVVYIRSVYLIIDGGAGAAAIHNSDIDVTIDNITGEITITTSLETKEPKTYSIEYSAKQLDKDGTTNAQLAAGTDALTTMLDTNGFYSAVSNKVITLLSRAPKGLYQIAAVIKEDGIVVKTLIFNIGFQIYGITYNSNGGSLLLPVDTNAYEAGTSATVLFDNLPTRTGYDFVGWATTSNASTAEFTQSGTKTIQLADNVQLYAVWKLKTFSITYMDGSKELNGLSANSYTFGQGLATLPTTSKPGYDFKGWFDAATGGNKVESISVVSTENLTLYVQWTKRDLTKDEIDNLGSKSADVVVNTDASSIYQVSADAKDVLKDSFTPDDARTVADGGAVDIRLEVAMKDVAQADKAAIEAGISDYDMGFVFDVSVNKYVTDANGKKTMESIKSLNTPVHITIQIPTEYLSSGRNFSVVRYHEGVCTLLADEDTVPETYTFSTNLFSTYAVVYMDHATTTESTTTTTTTTGTDKTTSPASSTTTTSSAPDTGDDTPLLFEMILLMATACLMTYRFGKKIIKKAGK